MGNHHRKHDVGDLALSLLSFQVVTFSVFCSVQVVVETIEHKEETVKRWKDEPDYVSKRRLGLSKSH